MNATQRINGFAMIGDMRTGALVGPDGTIAWMCLPRFDASAQFASILGTPENGAWHLKSADLSATITRRYDDATLVLETTFTTAAGSAKLVDFMPVDSPTPTVVRIVEGIAGTVRFDTCVSPRMKFGSIPPLTSFEGDAWLAITAPDGLCLRTSVPLRSYDHDARASFEVNAGERVAFTLQWYPAFAPVPERIDPFASRDATRSFWKTWSDQFAYDGEHRDLVLRSAISLKALSSRQNGSFVAALTTSLPEKLGANLNWDYRYAWLRDCSFAVESLLRLGFRDEAKAWRTWFARTYAGCTPHLKIMYAVDGSRATDEMELPWLRGFADSAPVRIGNNAHAQFQLGVYGTVLTSFDRAQRDGLLFEERDWETVVSLIEYLELNWKRPDSGIWEKRDAMHQYVDSKLMVWAAIDRALQMAKRGNLPLDRPRWQKLRDEIHDEICRAGYDPVRNTFTQYYGSLQLDASTLLMLVLGFLPPDDPRMIGTVDAIAKALYDDGYVYRYGSDDPDGSRSEGSFAICGFWLVQAYVLIGRRAEAERLFETLIATANDVGLFSEEYSVADDVALGNYPQAFSHAGLIEAACLLYGGVVATR